jgi:hypothetical protein
MHVKKLPKISSGRVPFILRVALWNDKGFRVNENIGLETFRTIYGG